MSMVSETMPKQILAPLTVEDAPAVARMHRMAINTGFLTALGQRFTEQMYRAILSCPSAFGLGVRDEDGELVGFITCAENTRKLYQYSLLRHGLSLAAPLLRHVCRPRTIKRLWETLRYPTESGSELPEAEILSIAVSTSARSHGIGHILMESALIEFGYKGISHARVAVAAANETANRFYRRHGFELSVTRMHHGLSMNVYRVCVTDVETPVVLKMSTLVTSHGSSDLGSRSNLRVLHKKAAVAG